MHSGESKHSKFDYMWKFIGLAAAGSAGPVPLTLKQTCQAHLLSPLSLFQFLHFSYYTSKKFFIDDGQCLETE